jgi:hypothetical protein
MFWGLSDAWKSWLNTEQKQVTNMIDKKMFGTNWTNNFQTSSILLITCGFACSEREEASKLSVLSRTPPFLFAPDAGVTGCSIMLPRTKYVGSLSVFLPSRPRSISSFAISSFRKAFISSASPTFLDVAGPPPISDVRCRSLSSGLKSRWWSPDIFDHQDGLLIERSTPSSWSMARSLC